MTEQERPRTEAGRDLIEAVDRTMPNYGYEIQLRERVKRIEAEGRQQAVPVAWLGSSIRAHFEDWGPHQCGYDPCAVNIERHYKRLAGLNASESMS